MKNKILTGMTGLVYTLSYSFAQMLGGLVYAIVAAIFLVSRGAGQGIGIAMDQLLVQHMILVSALSSFFLLIAYGAGYKYTGTKLKQLYGFHRISVSKLAVSLLSGFSVYGIVSVLLGLLAWFLPGTTGAFEQHSEQINFMFTGFLPSLILVGVLMPVLEELFFRGVIINLLKKHFGTVSCIFLSAIFFGLAHLNPLEINFIQPIYAFALGILFAVLRHRFNSVFAPALAHIAFNSFSVFLYFFIEPLEQSHPELFNMIPVAMLIVSLVVLPLCMVAVYFLGKKKPSREPESVEV